ncbi:hypothetical protein GF340_00455 [Candidatus Peregrinibacteria bacterium]|nr:hypothetical protein [Candidatus Peregrinibacteria bacterium]
MLKKALTTTLILTLLTLAGCSSVPSNLTEAEQQVYQIQNETAKKVDQINNFFASNNINYERAIQSLNDLKQLAENGLRKLENLKDDPKVQENVSETIRTLQSTERLTAKIEELSTKANTLVGEGKDTAQNEIDQLNKQIDGYVKRLESAQEKLDRLSKALADN